MNALFKIITLLVLISLSQFTDAQKQNLQFEHFSRKEGLSQSTVYAILQDSQGFMWFGTQDGLNKYDGYTFTHYRFDPQNPNSLGNNFIFSICEDQKGNLWIGTDGGGLNKYDRKQDKFIRYQNDPNNPNSLSNNVVLSVYEDSMGNLWISTYGGLNKFEPQQNQFMHYQHDPQDPTSLSSNVVWRIHEDSTGTLWVGADNDGLNRFDRKNNHFIHYQNDPQKSDSLSSDRISAIYEDSTGTLWVGTDGSGLNQFDREHNRFIRYQNDSQNPNSLSNNIIWYIYEDSNAQLWIGTDGGLNRFDRQNNQFISYQHDPKNPNSLTSNYIMFIYEDHAGALWLGTDGGGLNKFDPRQNKFAHYFHDPQNTNTLSHNLVSTIYEDSIGTLWVGTFGGGLNQFDQNREQITHYQNDPQNPNSLSHDEVWSLYEDKAGILWVGTFGGGLNQFDRQQNRFVRHYRHEPQNPDSLSNDKVRTIYEDKTGTLWIGTREGLNQFDREQNKFIHYRQDSNNSESLSSDNILSIYEDRKGFLWIGTQGGGLNQFDPHQDKFVRYQNDPQNPNSISHNEVFAIYEDKTGILWIGTLGGGLNQFNRQTETFTHYRETDGLANDVVYGMLEDNQGNLWLSTNEGLSKFHPKTQTFRNYDALDGLQSNEFKHAYYKSRRGEFFFGGINGFNVFYPELVKDNPYIPPVVITDFKIFNKSVKVGKDSPLSHHISVTSEMTLSYKQSFFSFEFAALNFLLPNKNKYKYQLEGFDNDWNEIGTRRNAYYTKVPHGNYVFRVKGSNNDEVWNEQGTAIKMTVLPPLWKTWWAYTFYVITILAILLHYRRIQLQKIQKKQQELEREQKIAAQLREADKLKDQFLANTSHELRTPINGIIGIAESLIEGAVEPISQPLQANLSMIVSSGRRLTNLVNDILDFSKLKKKELDLQLKNIDMRTIAEMVLALSQPLIGHKEVQLTHSISADLPFINADENRVQQILYNLVGNAIKFTDNGTVEILAEVFESSFLAISVSDTGIGIPTEKLDRIFEAFEQVDGSTARVYGGTGLGLAVTQQLVRLHGGQMWVQSQLGVGSNFTFTLPISDTQGEPAESSCQLIQPFINTQSLSEADLIPALHEMQNTAFPKEETVINIETETTPLLEKFIILIVDDEQLNRQVLLHFLSLQKNYTIYQAASGTEALKVVENDPKPDLILLDIMMPRMNGYEVCQRLKENEQTRYIPVIFLSALNEVLDKVKGFSVGGVDYITKPLQPKEILARVKTHLSLRHLQQQFETQNIQLQQELIERQEVEETLRQTNQELQVALKHLKATQAELIQREKMAALGQVMAGVAHEINTPLGAIYSAVGSIKQFLTQKLAQLPTFFRSLPEELQHDFFALLQKSLESKMALSSREERQLKRKLIHQLAKYEIKNSDLIADTLVDMSIYDNIEPFLPLLQNPDGQKILKIAYQLSNLHRNSTTIDTATQRASKVLFALKSFSHYDQTGEKTQADIAESIETVLTLYHNQLKQGIEVIKHYTPLPLVLCYPDELTQVWTNLIHNALQAMGCKGILTIEITEQDNQVVIRFTDNGKGIPEDIKGKIFEPFFTTKPPGEGSGLGLDIVKQIIAKHNGNIIVESIPGQTTFTVSLPILSN